METLQKYREEILHYLMTFMGGFMGLYAICAHGSYGSAQTGNLMDLLIDVSDGNGFSAAARIGAFLIFSSGIAARGCCMNSVRCPCGSCASWWTRRR